MDQIPDSRLERSAPTQPQFVFVDTDIGDDIDDALALALVLRSSELKLVGVTTVFGETILRARLAMHLLEIFEADDVPVAAGRSLPLQWRHRPSEVPQAAVLDATAAARKPHATSAADLLIRTARHHAGELTLLCLGPLTNVAIALQKEASLARSLQGIILMGGTSGLPFADWNVRSDPTAARIVFEAGVPITMVGWNVTRHCHLRIKDLKHFHQTQDVRSQLVLRLISAWQRHRPWWHSSLPSLHDPLAVAALCAPQFFRFAEIPVCVLNRGLLTGFTIPRWPGGSIVVAAMRVQCEEARAWMMRRWFSAF